MTSSLTDSGIRVLSTAELKVVGGGMMNLGTAWKTLGTRSIAGSVGAGDTIDGTPWGGQPGNGNPLHPGDGSWGDANNNLPGGGPWGN
jgi:hypothetical protein